MLLLCCAVIESETILHFMPSCLARPVSPSSEATKDCV